MAGSDISGVENARTGSITDTLTREHRMTFDEAQLILNVKRNDGLEQTLKVSCPLDFVWDSSEACFRIMNIYSKPIYPQH